MAPAPELSLRQQFSRFLLAGGLAALANFGSRFLFSAWLEFEYAVILAFFVGLTTGFLLSRMFVFLGSGNTLPVEIGYYLLVNLLALVQTWLISVYGAVLLERWMDRAFAQAVAHFIGVGFPVVTSYYGHRHFTFRRRADTPE
jgi:putative flippase GtrA